MPLQVLLVEDNPGDARLLRELLAEAGAARFSLEVADRLSAALGRLAAGDISAVLLDLGLPDSEGFETFSRLQAQAPGVPILVLTGMDDEALAVRAVREGAQDYLVKGKVEGELLVRAIRYAIERKRVEEEFRQMNRALEQRVHERTAELERANEFLRTVVQERKRAEEELSRYFMLSLDLFCIAGFDGYFKRLNPAWEKTLGFTPVELLARPYLEFVHPDDREATRAQAEGLAGGETVLSFENRYVCQDGSVRWFLWKAVPLPEAQLIYAAAHDITERKQAEQALAQSEQRTRRVIDQAHDAFIAMDADGLITEWNPQAEATFGWARGEALGRPLADLLIPPRFREAHWGGLKHFLATGEGPVLNQRIEMLALHRDGREFPVELSITPLRVGDTCDFNAFLRDITARKQAETALQQRTAELEATNQELEAFTYSVSHDLRAPLRHIHGFSRILLEDFGARLEPEARGYLDRIVAGVGQMGALIDDLLNLARVGRQEVKLQVTGLNLLVEEVRRGLEPEANGRQVEWRIGALPFVECDPALMKQVFANLLSNALKYTRPRAQALIEVGALTENGRPVIFVRDNGVGFSMKYADKLFGVFQRLHRQEDFEGTGVGLATVQRIVHKHGGRVWAEAALDQGATFYLTLGAAGLEAPAPTAAKEAEWTRT